MSLEAGVTAALARVGQEIKKIRSEQGGGEPAWEFGPFATQNQNYKTKALNAGTEKLKFSLISDSTGDGYTGGLPGGSVKWGDLWAQRFVKLLRAEMRLPKGGEGWIPPKVPTWVGGYSYNTATYLPLANAGHFDDLNFQTGTPGGLWLQEGHGTNVYDVTYALTPGTTSVDIVYTGYAGNMLVNGVSYNSVGERQVLRVTNPGQTLHLVGESGIGFALFGIYEYVGDETVGVEMMNISQAAIRANEFLGWFQDTSKSTKALQQAYSPDVAMILLGSNDMGYGNTPAEAFTSLSGIVTEVRSVVPDVEIVFLIRPSIHKNWDTLCNLVINGAAGLNASYLDMRPLMPPLTDTSVWLSDQTHFTAQGEVLFAQKVAEYFSVKQTSGGLTTQEVQTQIDDTIMSNVPLIQGMIDTTVGKRQPRLRRLTYGAGGQGNTVSPAVTFSQRSLRIPVKLFADTTRWRIRAWNNNYADPLVSRPNGTGKGIVIADSEDYYTLPKGLFKTGAPVTTLVAGDYVIPGAAPVGGDFYNSNVYTSPWFTDPAAQFKDGVERVIGTGIVMSGNTAMSQIEQLALWSSVATDGVDPTKTSFAAGLIPFSFFIEYETITDKEVAIVFGDSIPTGIMGYKGAAQASHIPVPTYWNYPNRWGASNNVLVQQSGFSGLAANNYGSSFASQLFGRFDFTTPEFDIVIVQLGSNDAAASVVVSTYQDSIKAILDFIRPKAAPNAEAWVLNIAPRALAASPETFRVTYNDWLSMLPFGITGVVDMDGAFSNGTTGLKSSLSMDGIHWSMSGQVRGATELEKIRKKH